MLARLKKWFNTTGKPATAGYEHGPSGLIYANWHRRPPWSYWYADLMLLDPQVWFGLMIGNGPLMSARVEVKCKSAEIKQFIEEQWKRIWSKSATQILRTKQYGFLAFEVVCKEVDGRIEFDYLRDFHPVDVGQLRDRKTGFRTGIRVRQIVRMGGNGTLDLMGPKGLWLTYGQEFSRSWGRALLERCYQPWYDKNSDNGALDLRRLHGFKDAWMGDMVKYPFRIFDVPGVGKVHGRDLAREIAENRASGGVVMLPSTVDKDGNPEWDYKPPVTTGGQTAIPDWIHDLDWDILDGLLVPKEVVEAGGTGGGWSGRSVPWVGFLAVRDQEFAEYVRAIKKQHLDPLALANFGKGADDFDVNPVPLVETMGQQVGEMGKPELTKPEPAAGRMPPEVRDEAPPQQFSTFAEEDHPRDDGKFTDGTGATHGDVLESESQLKAKLAAIHSGENVNKASQQYLGKVKDFYPSHERLHPNVAEAHVFYDPQHFEAASTNGKTIRLGAGAFAGKGSAGSLGDTFVHELEHLHDEHNGIKRTEFTPRLRQMLRSLENEPSVTGFLNKHRHENIPAHVESFFRDHPGHELSDEERKIAARAVHAKAASIFEARHQFSAQGLLWEESEHPRNKDGEFTNKGGGVGGKAETFENNTGKQGKLFHGMDALPGQKDLFEGLDKREEDEPEPKKDEADPLEELKAEAKRRGLKTRDIVNERIKQNADENLEKSKDAKAVVLENGEKTGIVKFMVTPSAQEKGRFQATWYGNDGKAMGHTHFDSLHDAILSISGVKSESGPTIPLGGREYKVTQVVPESKPQKAAPIDEAKITEAANKKADEPAAKVEEEKPLEKPWNATQDDLQPVKPRKFPKGAWRGEVRDAEGNNIGMIWVEGGRAYVGEVKPFGHGEAVKLLPGSYDPKSFTRAGGMRISAGSSVRFWKFKIPEGEKHEPKEKTPEKPAAKPAAVAITGNTFAHKDAIKAAGGKWDAQAKHWTISPEAAKKLEHITGLNFRGPGDRPAQFSTDSDGHWITIGAVRGPDGKKHGGTPVKISGGKITHGPKHLKGKTLKGLAKKNPHAELRRAVRSAAKEHSLPASDLHDAVEFVHEERARLHHERERAKEHARKLTGLTAGDISRLANAGHDYSSGHKVGGVTGEKLKHFDEFAQEVAREHPELGLGDPDDPRANFAEGLWNVLAEGKREAPQKHHPDTIEEAVNLLHSARKYQPAEEDDAVPFSIADPPLTSRSKTADAKEKAVEAATPLAAAIQARLARLLKKK